MFSHYPQYFFLHFIIWNINPKYILKIFSALYHIHRISHTIKIIWQTFHMA